MCVCDEMKVVDLQGGGVLKLASPLIFRVRMSP
jgi:hypothetical protein